MYIETPMFITLYGTIVNGCRLFRQQEQSETTVGLLHYTCYINDCFSSAMDEQKHKKHWLKVFNIFFDVKNTYGRA